jgi:MATE family multidrug resistance protein
VGLSLLLGFPGIALGTVLAQWSGFTYCLVAARRRYGFRLGGQTLQQGSDGRFFALNRDLFLRSVGMIAVYIGFTMISARYGDLMLAVSAILMKLLMFFSYFSDGFAYAGEALTGRFIGEGSREGVRATVRGTFAWGGAVAALFMLVYGLGGVPILQLMTDDASVVEAGRAFLPWLLLMPLIGCPAFIWDGIFIGATASKDLRNSTLLCAVGFFAVWFAGAGFVKTPEAAIHLLMAAYFVHLAIRAGYLTLRWPSYQY